MPDGALEVLIDGEIALLLRDQGLIYDDYYHAISNATAFQDGNSVESGIAYGKAPDGRCLEMKYRVLPGEGLHLRGVQVLREDDYARRLQRAIARRDG